MRRPLENAPSGPDRARSRPESARRGQRGVIAPRREFLPEFLPEFRPEFRPELRPGLQRARVPASQRQAPSRPARGWARTLALLCLSCAWLTASRAAAALEPPTPRIGASQSGAARSSGLPLELGKSALEKGQLDLAAQHFLHALEAQPGSADIIELLLQASREAPDERVLWSERWHLAACDEEGRSTPRGKLRDWLSPQVGPALLAPLRAQAVAELLRMAATAHKDARSRPQEEILAAWARRLARELARESPALERLALAAGPPWVEVIGTPWSKLVKELERALSSALSAGRVDEAIRSARILVGMAAQADFPDLQGEAPKGFGALRKNASEGLERARKLQRDRGEKPWTVDDLEWLSQEESESFTRAHDSFAAPGAAVSPREWYRLETDCGLETLLGVARTVEDHHQRLVNWYGQDPFVGIQGTVRVVPEASGLEAEGAGFWWVGGFQGGNVTTLRFSIGTIEGLGHGLTHELTHRFDGAIFPGQPAWLSEGKATWTAGAFGHSSDSMFEPAYADFGSMGAALGKGYGSEQKLGQLIDGEIEDYRDNYPVGHALYVFLNQWRAGGVPEGALLFREPLEEYMRSLARLRGKPREHFVQHFADGRQGRPADFTAFAQLFGEFLAGFHWKTEKPWKLWFKPSVPAGPNSGYVYDEPTWVWTRNRAEPYFGDEQARLAAEFLLDLGQRKEAVAAYLWSLACDGRRPQSEEPLAKLLEQLKYKDSAWVLRRGLPWEGSSDEPEPAPFALRLPKCRALLEALAQHAAACEEAQWPRAAAAALAQHERLGQWLGLPSPPQSESLRAALRAQAESPGSPESAAPAARRAGIDEAARWLEVDGWEESGLTGYEERRVPGLWYSAGNGELHVGREAPRQGSGKLDPRANQRDAFVLGQRWILPGSWRLRARVQATTAFVSGSVVLGYSRRDRNLRFDFSSGDFMFAIGESDEVPSYESLDWGLHGLFDREGGLSGTAARGRFDFGRERTSFELELAVDGASVRAFVDGKPVATYTSPDGVAIEGQIGFAVSMGAIRVQEPLVERLDRSRHAGLLTSAPLGLDPRLPNAPPFPDLVNRVMSALPPASNGTLVLWIGRPAGAEAELEPEQILSDARKSTERLARLVQRDAFPQPVRFLFPACVPEARRASFLSDARELFLTPPTSGTHAFDGRPAVGAEDPPDRGRNWLLFVDSCNVVRQVAPFFGTLGTIDEGMRHWLTVFRDHGRPARDLPAAVRRSKAPEEPESTEPGGGR